jgi:hypothetical protein
MTLAAPKNGDHSTLESKDAALNLRPLRESAALYLLCQNLSRPRARWIGDNEAFATVLPASELEQSAFVALLPKNGLHRASRRLQGDPTVERVEGQFNGYRSGAGTEPSAGSADAPRNFGSAFDAGRR